MNKDEEIMRTFAIWLAARDQRVAQGAADAVAPKLMQAAADATVKALHAQGYLRSQTTKVKRVLRDEKGAITAIVEEDVVD